MEQRAARLAEYVSDRLGDSLRAVGYHTGDTYEIVHVRGDLLEQYPPDRIDEFIDTSRNIHDDLQHFDDQMGPPEATLHVLKEGLIVQFHFPGEDVVFISMERDVGRNFTRFIEDCRTHMT